MSQYVLFVFLVQVAVCLFSVQMFGFAFEKMRAPKVFGEIFAGVLLGPSFFGFFAPTEFQLIYGLGTDSSIAFRALQEFGLLLLMFCSGVEVQFINQRKDSIGTFVSGLLGVAFPFIVAFNLINFFDTTSLIGPNGSIDSIKYFFAISCAVTSIPVLSRIFIDLDLIKTKFASICLSTALIEDLILYALLTLFIPLHSESEKFLLPGVSSIIAHTIISILFVLTGFKWGPYLLLRLRNNKLLKSIFKNYVAFSLLVLIIMTLIAMMLGIPSFLGAFIAGVLIGKTPIQNSEYTEHIKNFSFATFVPIFFFGVGLKLNFIKDFYLISFLLFMFFSSLFKVFGVFIAYKIAKFSSLHALNFGIALNARGGPGIVLATIGFDSGLISEGFFVTLILTALLTSWFAGYWLKIQNSTVRNFI